MDIITGEDLRHLLIGYGYLAIFLVVALEAMGIPMPGETMLILASVYAGTTHHLAIGQVIATAMAGAILGDNLGFLIGRHGGYPVVRRYGRYVGMNERRLRLGEYLFDRHGGKVVFFGRFLPILRTWAAFLAGTHRMAWPRFLACNAAGGIVWATSIGMAAFLFGNILLEMGGAVSVASVVAGSFVIAIVIVALHWRERRLQEQADREQWGKGTA